jgi:tetratricopeptide (TPR) repeat protein
MSSRLSLKFRAQIGGRLIFGLILMSLATGCRQSADAHFRKADDYAAKLRLPEAIVEYRSALQVDPKRGDIRRKLADAYVRNHDPADALREYVRAADLLPNDPAVQLQAGNFLLAASAFEDAKGRADKVLKLEPRSLDGQILLGNALAGLKDIDGAIAEYEEAIALDPTQGRAYLGLGALQLVSGRRAEAEATFRTAIEIAPKSVPARMALANFFWASNRASEAERTLKDALALAPDDAAANRALGLFYLSANRAPEAEPYFKALASGSDPSAGVTLADYYVAVHRLDDAEKTLRGLTSKKETHIVATTRLAALLAAKGQGDQGLTIVQDLLAKEPKETAARLVHARLLGLKGKADEALAETRAIVADAPNSPLVVDAYVDIGWMEARRDHTEDAIKAYEEALKRKSRSLGASLGLGTVYLSTGSVDKASTYAQAAIRAQPNDVRARALMVRVLLAERDVSQAHEALASLKKDFPNAPVVLDLVAAQQQADHQTEAARASYAQASQIAPDDLEALSGLVNLDLAARRPAEAVSRIETALKRAQPSGELYMVAGQTYAAANNAAKAEEMLKRAIETEPSRLRAYGLLGQLYISQRRLDDARLQFQQIAEQNPKSTSARTMLGMLLEAQHRLTDAEQQYQKVLALDAHAAVAANNLAWLYVASNRNLDQALQLAQGAQQQLSDEPHVNDTLGWIYYRKNMPSSALRHLEASVRKDAGDPTTHYHLGMAYVQLGDLDKGKKELQRALTFKAEFDGIAEARTTLSQLGG